MIFDPDGVHKLDALSSFLIVFLRSRPPQVNTLGRQPLRAESVSLSGGEGIGGGVGATPAVVFPSHACHSLVSPPSEAGGELLISCMDVVS